jgi:acyl-coenzyme A thioesterase PaaI-like protein
MTDLPDDISIQEHYLPEMTCFGCGPANPKGLQLRSFAADGGTVAEFAPRSEHDNGLGFLNGGIICTVIDCHSATPMILEAARLGIAEPGGMLPFVTAGLSVQYLRPTPLSATSQLFATTTKIEESSITIDVELTSEGKTRAVGTAVWKRWLPR